MTLAMIIALIVGLGLVVAGLLGRRVGDEPRCAGCLFDLSGQDDPHDGVCPECGADLSAPGATRTGVRRRRWGLATAGVLAMLPGLGGIGLFAYAAATTPRDQPTWYLLLRAEHGSLLSAGSTLNEIQRRYGARQLTDEQIAPIIERSLGLLVDDTIEWRPTLTNSWTGFASDMRRSGAFTEDQALRFHGAVFEPVVAPEPAVVTAGQGLRVSASLARSPRTSARTTPFRRYVRLRAITVGGVRSPIESDPSLDLVALANTSDSTQRWNWAATAPMSPGVYDLEAEFEVFVPKVCVDPATIPPQNLPNFIPQGELVRIRTVTSSARVRVVSPDGVIAPVTSDEAVEDAKNNMFVLLFVADGFDEPADGDVSVVQQLFAMTNTELLIVPTEADVGGEFSVSPVSPHGEAFDLAASLTIPGRRVTDPQHPPPPPSSRHIYLEKPPLHMGMGRGSRSDAPTSTDGWRLELTPLVTPSNERLLEAADRDGAWVPLPTLQRPITMPLAELTHEQIQRLSIALATGDGASAGTNRGEAAARSAFAMIGGHRLLSWPLDEGRVYIGVHGPNREWLEALLAEPDHQSP